MPLFIVNDNSGSVLIVLEIASLLLGEISVSKKYTTIKIDP